jgi:hypothetical protein
MSAIADDPRDQLNTMTSRTDMFKYTGSFVLTFKFINKIFVKLI